MPAVAFTDPENYNHQAKRHAERLDNAVWTNQFDNVANRQAHIETTGPEIWAQLTVRLMHSPAQPELVEHLLVQRDT